LPTRAYPVIPPLTMIPVPTVPMIVIMIAPMIVITPLIVIVVFIVIVPLILIVPSIVIVIFSEGRYWKQQCRRYCANNREPLVRQKDPWVILGSFCVGSFPQLETIGAVRRAAFRPTSLCVSTPHVARADDDSPKPPTHDGRLIELMMPAMPIALAIGALKAKEVTMLRSLASS
jgi:hypothetical protein